MDPAKMSFSRRSFVKLSVTALGTLLLPAAEALPAATPASEPHFFLLIVLDGGADPSYMFDARPLAMTEAGIIQNYLGEEPAPWIGRNGVRTLATRLVSPLAPYRDRFSVLNGVYMTPSFDGHLQNMNFLLSGNPFGGASFVPHLNAPDSEQAPQSLDAILLTEPPSANLTNHAKVVHLLPKSLAQLAARLRQTAMPEAGDAMLGFVRERMQAAAEGNGRMAQGARLMLSGLERARELHGKLSRIKVPSRDLGPEQQSVALLAECFRLALARSAILVLREPFDVHAADQAKQQPKLFASAIGKISDILKGLAETSFDAQRSMLDVTTFMVASEFGRTLRARGMHIDNTGTHHNQLGNSILIGGKGIVGGLVLGATDFAEASEQLSGAHRALDPYLEKAMGRPFDVSTLRSRPDLPESFEISNYLTIGSVVNSLYALFGVPKAHYRPLARNLAAAPVLEGLLA
jgi:hypothetical protein